MLIISVMNLSLINYIGGSALSKSICATSRTGRMRGIDCNAVIGMHPMRVRNNSSSGIVNTVNNTILNNFLKGAINNKAKHSLTATTNTITNNMTNRNMRDTVGGARNIRLRVHGSSNGAVVIMRGRNGAHFSPNRHIMLTDGNDRIAISPHWVDLHIIELLAAHPLRFAL